VENFVRVDGEIINYTSRLHLNKIHHNDAGRFQCIITNEFGSAYSSKAEISVHGKRIYLFDLKSFKSLEIKNVMYLVISVII